MADNTIKIGGELESMATGKIVAAASAIKDKSRHKTQEVINGDVEQAIAEQSAQFEALSEETSAAVESSSQSARKAKQYLADLQEAITELPDGQAVSAQVAVNEVDIAGLKSDVVVDLSTRYATSYANLSAALTALNSDTAADATAIKKAGVSIKFINSTTNKYEQWNLKASSWSINESDWALDVDGSVLYIDTASLSTDFDIRDENGHILVKFANGHIQTKNFNSSTDAITSAQKTKLAGIEAGAQVNDVNVDSTVFNSDLDITDENGNILAQFKNGEIRVKEFNSANAPKLGNTVGSDLEINDSNGNVLVRFSGGHIETKFFDSRNSGGGGSSDPITTKYNGKRICVLGDSISTFGDPDSRNQNGTYCYSYYPTQTCRYSASGNVTEGGSTYDSIQFDVQNTWWMKLINQLGASLGINESWRGTKVSGSGNNIFASQTRIGHLGGNGTPDLILVYGGTNDAGATAGKTPEQVAGMLGTFNTENPASYTDEQIAALPTTTFADAYRTMLIRLQKTYPSSEIVVILPTFTSTYYTITNLDLFVEVIKEACDFFGVKYIDIRTCGITCFNKNTYLVDGIHPNVAGMKLISDKIYKHLIYN